MHKVTIAIHTPDFLLSIFIAAHREMIQRATTDLAPTLFVTTSDTIVIYPP